MCMHHYLRPTHRVLEFGSGGSTVFMARRVKNVVAFESLPGWEQKTRHYCLNHDLYNVEIHECHDVKQAVPFVGDSRFDVALVDCVEIDRRDAVAYALSVVDHPGLLVIDNYSAPYCTGIDALLSHIPPERITNYDDPHWVGNGTKVVYL